MKNIAMKLILVYNAKSGKINSILDSVHKIISPETYKCSLCKLTHDIFGEREEWIDYKKSSGLDFDFLHLDEFQEIFKNHAIKDVEYPLILKEEKGGLEVFISKSELEQYTSLQDLLLILNKKVKNQ